ncbi:N5-carboxyaminoimidazole ribonucleotide mutase [Neorickettsia helminthoeca str. Oregon]|uniref:N5-carboxyaminoimidazole ribonucleotide mutase n=1 Tax=Neorickettsia helminthoeca str. Oregon TaxID=1286528 RepID=X5HJD0_9RICK|nr:5-(carboxyamino)imidazole ribonucleotide mutase [Neorickettsia helminthoeca]AHX11179.1 N5-carboxyaminoimidazole ribonucleotide mutase [Neorickettsia helminthoeca str. Oregon]
MSVNKVSVIMGSTSDYTVMCHAERILKELDILFETMVISAHRTPERLYTFARNAENRGIEIIIAGAGGAAHLPGMVASMTSVPVLGVPIEGRVLHGIDSLLSICQMPSGTPVATFSIGKAGAENAALFAGRILGMNNKELKKRVLKRTTQQSEAVPISPNPEQR